MRQMQSGQRFSAPNRPGRCLDMLAQMLRRDAPESDVANAWEVQKLVDAVYASASRGGEAVKP